MPYLFLTFVFAGLTVYFHKNPGLKLGFKEMPKMPRIELKKIDLSSESVARRIVLFGAVIGFLLFALIGNAFFVIFLSAGPFMGLSYLKRKQQKDREKFLKKNLLSAVNLLWIPCDAGLNFKEAVKKLSRETDNPIIHELDRCYLEIGSGKKKENAFKDLVKRTISEVESLLRAVTYNESMGAPIADFLYRESERMQMEKRARIQEIGDKLSSKVLFVVLGVMVPALIVMIFIPIANKFQVFSMLFGQ